MTVSIVCIALLGLLVFSLGLNVSVARAHAKTIYGGEVNAESRLFKAQRAHGNTIEYAPMLAVMMLALALTETAAWVNWVMALAVFFRYLFVIGILLPATMAKPNPMRFLGALGTYITGPLLVLALLTL